MVLTLREREALIAKLVPAAQAAQKAWGVRASILIAQAIDESQWGTSELVRKRCNWLGIRNRQGEDYKAFRPLKAESLKRFRKFASVEDCLNAHARMLATIERYVPCMKVAQNARRFCESLALCGYYPDHERMFHLQQLIRNFDLTRFDHISQEKKAS